MIGQTVSHYRILEKIGSGGMGEIFLAEDTKLERKVALKFLPRHLTEDKEANLRFEREAKAAAALNHSNIVTIHEIGEHEGQVFIAMEYVEGKTLKEIISGHPAPSTLHPMPIPLVFDIATQIASGLAAAHAKGIVHRDIKPQNILVDKDNRVKILDFGLAKLKGVSSLTKESSTLGTVHYMSPEQTMGKEVDHRTDIWSLGVVLYEMLSDQLPFKGDYEQAVIYSILNEDPKKVTEIRKDIPPEFDRILEKALAKESAGRYSSISHCLDDLHAMPRKLEEKKGANSRPWKRRLILLTCGLAALAAILLLLVWKPWAMKAPAAIRSIAVLPLQNYSRDPEQDYFADGMTEALISELSRIKALRVISRTSAMLYKKSSKPLPEIARELKVDAVLEGSAQRVGDRIRITAQLIEATSDRHIWAEEYERDFADILTLQKEVSRAIAREIRITVTPEEKARLAMTRQVDPETHEAYLKGLFWMDKLTPADVRKGIGFFEEALRNDPDYALALAGLAEAYDSLVTLNSIPAKEGMEKMKALALKALSIDESLGEAHLILAEFKYYMELDFAGAEREYKLALELSPGYSNCYLYYANVLHRLARNDEAFSLIQRGLRIDPLQLSLTSYLGFHYYHTRQYDEAIGQLKDVLTAHPGDAYSHFVLGYVYTQKKMMAEAISEFQKAVDCGMGNAAVEQAYIHAKNGKPAMARSMLADLLEKSKTDYIAPGLIFRLYDALGETENAFAWMEKAVDDGAFDILLVWSLPLSDSLRADPRFAPLMRKLGIHI